MLCRRQDAVPCSWQAKNKKKAASGETNAPLRLERSERSPASQPKQRATESAINARFPGPTMFNRPKRGNGGPRGGEVLGSTPAGLDGEPRKPVDRAEPGGLPGRPRCGGVRVPAKTERITEPAVNARSGAPMASARPKRGSAGPWGGEVLGSTPAGLDMEPRKPVDHAKSEEAPQDLPAPRAD